MRILVISDLHAPYTHPDATEFLRGLKKDVKPDCVVCIGDEIDAHGWSRWDPDPDAKGPGDELAAAIDTLSPIFDLFPNVYVCESNHGDRAYKAAARARIPAAFLRPVREVICAPRGWKWADNWVHDEILFKHGDGFSGQNGAMTAAQAARSNTCIAHIHSWAGLQHHANECNTIFAMNVGCLLDTKARAMAYGKNYPHKPVIGCGVIIDGEPQFRRL